MTRTRAGTRPRTSSTASAINGQAGPGRNWSPSDFVSTFPSSGFGADPWLAAALGSSVGVAVSADCRVHGGVAPARALGVGSKRTQPTPVKYISGQACRSSLV